MGGHSHIRTQPAERLRAAVLALLALLALLLAPLGRAARAEPVRADVTVDTSRGFARIVLRFSDEIDADVRMANNIIVISFKSPVVVPIDRLPVNAMGYIGAARSDPDKMAVRMALARKV